MQVGGGAGVGGGCDGDDDGDYGNDGGDGGVLVGGPGPRWSDWGASTPTFLTQTSPDTVQPRAAGKFHFNKFSFLLKCPTDCDE